MSVMSLNSFCTNTKIIFIYHECLWANVGLVQYRTGPGYMTDPVSKTCLK